MPCYGIGHNYTNDLNNAKLMYNVIHRHLYLAKCISWSKLKLQGQYIAKPYLAKPIF